MKQCIYWKRLKLQDGRGNIHVVSPFEVGPHTPELSNYNKKSSYDGCKKVLT